MNQKELIINRSVLGNRYSILAISIVILVGVLLAGCQKAERVAEEPAVDIEAIGKDIKDFVREWNKAANSGDIDKLMSIIADNCVRIPPNAPPIIGKEAIRNDLQQMFDMYNLDGDEAVIEFYVSGDFAFSRGTWEYSLTPKAGGDSFKINGNMIDIYQKQPDGSLRLFWNMYSDESLVSSWSPD